MAAHRTARRDPSRRRRGLVSARAPAGGTGRRRRGGRVQTQLPEHDEQADGQGDDVHPIPERRPGVAGGKRVRDQREEADVDQRSRPIHDVAAGTPELEGEQPEAGEGEDRAEQAELLARVAELPRVGAGGHIDDALRQVDDDRLPAREVHPLEAEVGVVGGVRVLGSLKVLLQALVGRGLPDGRRGDRAEQDDQRHQGERSAPSVRARMPTCRVIAAPAAIRNQPAYGLVATAIRQPSVIGHRY